MLEDIKNGLLASAKVKERMAEDCVETIADIITCLKDVIAGGGKVLLCGNGGSAADSQHIATEIVVRLKERRSAQPAIALTTDTSIITAAGNDFGFETIFERQVDGLMRPEDVLVAISVSGDSENVLRAARMAKKKGGKVIAFTGASGGKLGGEADIVLKIPAEDWLVQEGHQAAYHLICAELEKGLST